MGAAAQLHPTTEQVPQAPAPPLSPESPDLVPSTSTEFTLRKNTLNPTVNSCHLHCSPCQLAPDLGDFPAGTSATPALGWRETEAEEGVERWEPKLPSLQKLPLSPHLAFLGPPACHTNTSGRQIPLALLRVFCNGGCLRQTGDGSEPSPGAGPSADQKET